MSSRREKIESMLEREPGDVFLRYALAMELEKDGQWADALALHEELTSGAPPHVASYFRSAQIWAAQQQFEQARSWLRLGIEAARSAGDFHAAAEMGQMLADLGREGE